jgi:hypothetical protein
MNAEQAFKTFRLCNHNEAMENAQQVVCVTSTKQLRYKPLELSKE